MNWKKNPFSYILWFVYAVMVSAGVLGVTVFLCNAVKFPIGVAFLIAAGELLGAGALVYVLGKVCREKNPYGLMNNSIPWRVAEILSVIVLIGGGAYLRISGIPGVVGAIEGDAFYAATTVAVGKSIPQVVHGATYFYLQLLHTIFVLFGNKAAAAVGFQIFLQLLAGIILYFAVRKLTGRLAGIIAMAFWMLSPYMAGNALELSPAYLFLVLYSFVFLMIGRNLQKKSRNPVCTVLIGILAGIVSYLDIFGFTLFFLFAAAFTVEREPHENFLNSPGAFVSYGIFGGIIGFVGAIAGDALSCGKEFVPVLRAWAGVYQPKSFSLLTVLNAEGFYVDFVLLFVLLAMGIYTFWCSRYYERQGVWIAVAFCLAVLLGLQVLNVNVGSTAYLYIFLAVLAGAAVEMLFVADKSVAEVGIENGILSSIRAEEYHAVEENEAIAEKIEVSREEPRKVQFLENPLPLPKKHERRVMDYRYTEVSDYDNDFDVSVSDDDDYDI